MNTRPATPALLKVAILALAAVHADLQAAVTARNDALGLTLFNTYADYQKVVAMPLSATDVLNKMGAVPGGQFMAELSSYCSTYASQPQTNKDYWYAITAIARAFGLTGTSGENSVDMGAAWVRDTLTTAAANGILSPVSAQALLDAALEADPVVSGDYEAALNLA